MSSRPRIAVIGGGPAGSTLVLELVRLGVDPADLVIYDRAVFPRPKLCGGAITFRGTETLAATIGQPAGGITTKGLLLVGRHGRLPVWEPGPQWVFDRAVLDAALLDHCRAAGVTIREGAAVGALEPGLDGWRVTANGATETFAWVAGADGAGGLTRRVAGLAGGRTGRLVEGVYEAVDADADPQTLLFDFSPIDDGIGGYAWIFPYPKPNGGRAWKLGIMDGRGDVPGSVLRRWTADFAARHGFRPCEDRLPGWPERYYERRAQGHRPGLVLVGEAYGIDPLLGEGITPAIHHARYVARRLRQALDQGRATIGGFEAEFLRTEEGWNLFFQEVMASRLYGPTGRRWLHVLFEAPGLRRMAEQRQMAYGRLGRRPARLTAIALGEVLRNRGLPPND